jgi:hypothetical protein
MQSLVGYLDGPWNSRVTVSPRPPFQVRILENLPSPCWGVSSKSQSQRGVEGRVLSFEIESACPGSDDPAVQRGAVQSRNQTNSGAVRAGEPDGPLAGDTCDIPCRFPDWFASCRVRPIRTLDL